MKYEYPKAVVWMYLCLNLLVDDSLLEDETNETWSLVLKLGEGDFKHFTKSKASTYSASHV